MLMEPHEMALLSSGHHSMFRLAGHQPADKVATGERRHAAGGTGQITVSELYRRHHRELIGA